MEPATDYAQIVASTASPAFAVDTTGRIVAWNAAAEEFFGHSVNEALGRSCWDLLQGRDPYGNVYCGPHCPLIEMAVHREAIHGCDMLFRDAEGLMVRTGVDSFIVPGGSPAEMVVVHFLRTIPFEAADGLHGASTSSAPTRNPLLTERELQVLRLMARGVGTQGISRELRISTGTTRKHIAKILQSLKAHTRLQAVAAARALRLID